MNVSSPSLTRRRVETIAAMVATIGVFAFLVFVGAGVFG